MSRIWSSALRLRWPQAAVARLLNSGMPRVGVGALVVVNEGVDDSTRGPVHRLGLRGKGLAYFCPLIVRAWG